MEIQEFLREHQLDDDIWDKKEELKKSFENSDDEKMKILIELFDYNFDYIVIRINFNFINPFF